MKYLKTGNPAVDVTGENIKSSSTVSRSIADILNIHEVTQQGTDLNNYKSQGVYFFASTVTPVHIPTGIMGFLVVLPATNYIKQIWFRDVAEGVNQRQTYVRQYRLSDTSWSDWSQYATTNQYGAPISNSGGYLGYNGLCSNANNTITQGQYHTNSTTSNVPTSKSGILLVYVGDAGVQQNDSSAHSWLHQIFMDNSGNFYTRHRLKTSGSWSAWRAAINQSTTVTVTLSSLTWHPTSAGMYYCDDITLPRTFLDIETVCISNWGAFSATLFVQPYISGTKVALMANKNSFGSASLTLKVTGTVA